MPDRHLNPARAFRIPDSLYRRAQEKARERGETLTAVIVRALERYVRR